MTLTENFSLETIVKTDLGEIVYDRLIGAIIRGELPPGYRFFERKLAASLGVSRTPVREALMRLHQEEMVSKSKTKGFYVAPISENEIMQIYPLIGVIESHLVREMGSLSKQHINELKLVDKAYLQATDLKSQVQLGNQWHATLTELSDNFKAKEILGGLLNHAVRFEYFFHRNTRFKAAKPEPSQTNNRGLTEHNQILEALEAFENQEAARLVELHWNNSAARLTNLMAD